MDDEPPRRRPGGWAAAGGLVWPVHCPGCGRPDVALCPGCRGAVTGPGVRVPVVGWPLDFGAWAACSYRGVPARLLISWKERGRVDLTGPLGAGLAAALQAARAELPNPAGGRPWLLVPVPTTRAGRRRRGADLALELARAAVAVLRSDRSWPGPAPVVLGALRHRRRVRDQSELGASRRRANLRGALEVRPAARAALAGRQCVVVDDIVTTGTTVAEAARALTCADARVVGACFLSVTLRQLGVPIPGRRD